MKKILTTIALTALAAFLLVGCCMSHDWQEATCLAPKTCAKCGATEGEPLEHSWQAASCEAAETCTLCGETRGEALGHIWEPADCDSPERCACGAEQGEAIGHKIVHNGRVLIQNDVPGIGLGTGVVHIGNCDICGEEGPVYYNDWNDFFLAFLTGNWRVDVVADFTTEQLYDVSEQNMTGQFHPDGSVQFSFDEEGAVHYEFYEAVQTSELNAYPTAFDLYGYLVDQEGNKKDTVLVSSTALGEIKIFGGNAALVCHSLDHPEP